MSDALSSQSAAPPDQGAAASRSSPSGASVNGSAPATGGSPPPAPPIGQRTAHSFAWMFGQGILDKLFTAGAQVALAYLLTEQDFDLVALTYTVTTFAALLQQAGLREVLIQRHRSFHLWSGAVFWMALTIGIAMGMLTVGVAPLAARYYHRPELFELLLIASLALPINALAIVPEAAIRARMQFRFMAMQAQLAVTLQLGLAIVFAASGLGAFSFILPQPIVGAVRVALMWSKARPRVSRRQHLRRWRFLLGDGAPLMIASLALLITYQGASSILGRMYHPAIPAAGVFYFAWSLSDQAGRLLINNLGSVMFPALRTLEADPVRQVKAFTRAARMLLILGTPLCLLQAVLAGPLIRLVFPDRWTSAIGVMAILSVTMASRMVSGPCESMFLAQRRQRTFMLVCIVYAGAFVVMTVAGSWLGPRLLWSGVDRDPLVSALSLAAAPGAPATGATLAAIRAISTAGIINDATFAGAAASGAALGVGLGLLLLAPIILRIALAPGGGRWRDVWRVFALPTLANVLVFLPLAFVPGLFSPTTQGDLLCIATVGLAALVFYTPVVRGLAPVEFNELSTRVRNILGRARK